MHPSTRDDTPLVTATAADTVALEISGDQAETLAFILGHYDAILATHEVPPVPDYEPDVWHQARLSLLIERALLRFPVAQTTDVDTSGRVAQAAAALNSPQAVIVALPKRAR
jgi:hypothetical protein